MSGDYGRIISVLKGKGIISAIQKRIIECFKLSADASSFYLSGGTALAEFYLGHRKSYDLDFFTPEEKLILPFSRILVQELERAGFAVTVVRRFSVFAEFEVAIENEATKLQLGYDSPFRFERVAESELGIAVNDYKDIIVDKLLAFFGRAEPRDAVDLFFILQQEEIWKLAELAATKDPGFELYWLAVACGRVNDFPEDMQAWPVEMIKQTTAAEIKNLFRRLSMEILDTLKAKR
jgi:hypothetical protein